MPTPFADIAWPSGDRYWLANARVPACFLADTAPAMSIDAEGVVRWSYVSPLDVNPGADGILMALDRIAPRKQAVPA